MTTPKKKIESVLKKAIETKEIECVETDDFLYAQPHGTLETLALFKPTFLSSKLNMMMFFGNNIFKDGQPDFTKALKMPVSHCNMETGLWTVNYADSDGMKSLMSAVATVMTEVQAPMGPFVPHNINGWKAWNVGRQENGLKRVGFVFGEQLKDSPYCHCTYPTGWKRVFHAIPSYKDKPDKVDVLDENGCLRAEISFSNDYAMMTFLCRYKVQKLFEGQESNAAHVLDYAKPTPAQPYTVIKEFTKKDIQFGYHDCETTATSFLNTHHRFWEDPIESWEPVPQK